jgi:signal transduction histidine kinase
MTRDEQQAMKVFLGFTAADEAALRGLARPLNGKLEPVADRFYDAIRADERALRLFTGGEAQIAHQRLRLAEWLRGLFSGEYGPAHFAHAIRVGQVHVEVSLPQYYMITGMQVIRQELTAQIRATKGIADPEKAVDSVHKLLALELGAMLEAYKTQYSRRIQHQEREAMEEKLTRAEHMAQLGQLAASLAHAIKNPLAGISGAIQVIRGSLPPDSAHRRIIDEMLAQIDRLDATVRDLLVYSRPRAPARVSLDLNELIARVLNVLREEPTLRRIRVRHVRETALTRMQADERQLEQVIMNLLLNAADASSEGDKVTITTSCDSCIRMVIADNGLGMTPEVLARAFEPFHTTKTKGTGLGLSICKQIVDAHGGRIGITSERHRGTTVTVELPIDGAPSRSLVIPGVA